MKGIVDRIEGKYVLLEIEDEMISIEKNRFPKELKEGDIVKDNGKKFIILKEETNQARKGIKKLFDDLKY